MQDKLLEGHPLAPLNDYLYINSSNGKQFTVYVFQFPNNLGACVGFDQVKHIYNIEPIRFDNDYNFDKFIDKDGIAKMVTHSDQEALNAIEKIKEWKGGHERENS